MAAYKRLLGNVMASHDIVADLGKASVRNDTPGQHGCGHLRTPSWDWSLWLSSRRAYVQIRDMVLRSARLGAGRPPWLIGSTSAERFEVVGSQTHMHRVLSQREIYDARYSVTLYDSRSAVRVLRAEREAMESAIRRILKSNRDLAELSVLDFGSGTGRVTRESILGYKTLGRSLAREGIVPPESVHVIAYDVSSVGLNIFAENLGSEGFKIVEDLNFQPTATTGYVAGQLEARDGQLHLRASFVHGSENDEYERVAAVLMGANGGKPFSLGTSWYSAIGHLANCSDRARAVATMVEITGDKGELILAVAASGDMVDAQRIWANRLHTSQTLGFPISSPGDLIYETEIGQQNFWHVFGTDLHALLEECLPSSREYRIRAIRMPGEEFQDEASERINYQRALDFNRRVGKRISARGRLR